MAVARKIKAKIGELLIEKGTINREQLEEALTLQRATHKNKLLGQIFVEMGAASEEDIYSAVAAQFGYPYIKITNYSIDQQVLNFIPKEKAQSLGVMPIDKIGNILTVAMVNPLEEKIVENLEKETGLSVKVFVSSFSELKEAVLKNYGP
ncbi:MAG: hypothetical protein COV72_03155 [Candidatus Omnitrophica bacterium CG11_big_fil_rev_8_21_14_0_20_42_13]|uniref:Type II secretion system protein GspE N-terminal domain-containing protein n=1 Tax=Candidatus Ghiorseimicrobium undicola TaxID=1974746 RepID=A0A2H0LYF4_9BACT|nr:MAG: hypothetical protein COV72_03155 [Candidatus Omnitrophica bacterium CG11_big_fil_rev_8_21_14_0_20_42_13]